MDVGVYPPMEVLALNFYAFFSETNERLSGRGSINV